MGELIKSAGRSLLRKRSRTLLTVIAIAMGVLMVSVVTVISTVGSTLVETELDSMGVNGLSVMAQSGGELISNDDLEQLRALSCVRSAAPLMVQVAGVSTQRTSCKSTLCGIDAGADQVISLELCHGRLISPGDVAAAARICVLDEELAHEMYGRSNIVGKTVTVRFGTVAEELTVVGITEAGSSLLQNFTSLIPGMLYLPYTTHCAITGQTDFDQVAIRVNTEQAEERVTRLLNRLHNGASPFRVDDLAVQKERLEKLVSMVVWILTAISAISLVVSGFGIVTAMLSAVSERTREIGIKKAIGATGGRIMLEFLVEAMVLSAAGALLGMIPAAALVAVFRIVGVSALWPWGTFAKLFVFSLFIGGVFGVYPAYKASRLQPVEALRSE